MPPPLAALITLSFCAYMLRREQRLHPGAGSALWLPVIWMFFVASRFPAQWLDVFGFSGGLLGSAGDGSPLDAIIFLLLTLLGMRTLHRRGFRLTEFVHENRWIALFLIYCLFAVLWSDMPYVSFKRWIKILGHPVMALVILTSPDPVDAIRVVLRKTAILLLPISLLLIKYYPAIGRSYDTWSGIPFHSGVTTMKNSLGAVCMLYALFLCWDLWLTWKSPPGRARKQQLAVSGGLFLLALHLLHLAKSATSQACLVLGMAAILLLASGWVKPRRLGTTLIVALVVIALVEPLFDLSDSVLRLLGRDSTLTERTGLWEVLMSVPINPVFGAGFEMFWSGDRVNRIAAIMGWPPNQAHNGYLETYLNLGVVGLLILCIWIFAGYGKIRTDLIKDFPLGQFGLAFLLAIVAYNYTEAAFKALHPLWTIFFLVTIRCEAFRWRFLSRQGDALQPEPEWLRPQAVGWSHAVER